MKKLILGLFILQSLSGYCQLNDLTGLLGANNKQKADELFENDFYEEAIVYYNKELEKYNFDSDVFYKLADCYRKISDYKKVRAQYLIIDRTSTFRDGISKFYYAESLLSIGEIDEARKWYQEYLIDVPNDPVTLTRLEGIAEISKFYADSSLHNIEPVGFNSEHTDFGAIRHEGGVLFSSAREKDMIIKHDNLRQIQSLIDSYFVELSDEEDFEAKRVKLKHHYKSNDGPITISGELAVLSRNNGKKENRKNTLGLHFYNVKKLNFRHRFEFEYNSDKYSIVHPALNETADTLFYASDMPGGHGGFDLFYSVKISEDEWSPPYNLGSKINTRANELFPYYIGGQLFFSSNGHEGIGGLDIYTTKLSQGTRSFEVTNVGYPINSGWDDISFYLVGRNGYLASNRPGGKGHDDIYTFETEGIEAEEVQLPTRVKILVKDNINSQDIPDADISLKEKGTKLEHSFLSDRNGEFSELLEQGVYEVSIRKEGFDPTQLELDLRNETLVVEEIYLSPILKMEAISLDSILFEYENFKLTEGAKEEMEYIVEMMIKYPNLEIQISAHTDSRGNADYNLWLSKMRAASTADFLEEQGIDRSRISTLGYGETQLLNDCDDNTPCTENEHFVNRRIEFEFSNYNSENN